MEDKLNAATALANHVVNRLCNDPDAAYLHGPGSQTWELAVAWVAAVKGLPEADAQKLLDSRLADTHQARVVQLERQLEEAEARIEELRPSRHGSQGWYP
jgi:hypothetical protein